MRATILVLIAGALLVAPASDTAIDPSVTSAPAYQHPVVEGHGKVVVVHDVAQPPKKGSKLLFDITRPGEPGSPAKGLDAAAQFLNLAGGYGLAPEDVQVAVVLHGEATRAVLHHAVFSQYLSETAGVAPSQNPNLKLLRELDKAGVDVYVCLQALASRKIGLDQVIPEVEPAAGALTVIANKAMDDYAYMPFH